MDARVAIHTTITRKCNEFQSGNEKRRIKFSIYFLYIRPSFTYEKRVRFEDFLHEKDKSMYVHKITICHICWRISRDGYLDSRSAPKHKVSKEHRALASYQASSNSIQWFQRKSRQFLGQSRDKAIILFFWSVQITRIVWRTIRFCFLSSFIEFCSTVAEQKLIQSQSITSRVIWIFRSALGSVPFDFLRPKFRVAHTKHDVMSILMNKYTYINMYIIKKIISCIFILYWGITALLKLKWKFAGYV